MLILPGCHSSWFVHYWAALCPSLFGHLWSPPRKITIYPHLNYVLDNGRYAAAVAGRRWDEAAYLKWVTHCLRLARKPMFVTVPDVPWAAKATLDEWKRWHENIDVLMPQKTKIPLAFVLQNGIDLDQVPERADWLFVGGTDEWRYPRLREIVQIGRPVHVGRINSVRRLRQCEEAGVLSVDGNGWFMGSDYRKLLPYIQERIARLSNSNQQLGLEGIDPLKGVAGRFTHRGILQAIRASHIQQAVLHWDHWGVVLREADPRRRASQRYGVLYEGQVYPPKLLVSAASVYATGQILPVSQFSGGQELNQRLERMGFEVVELTQPAPAQRLRLSALESGQPGRQS